jgi:hypothetical protein
MYKLLNKLKSTLEKELKGKPELNGVKKERKNMKKMVIHFKEILILQKQRRR